jgi:hypothetical protein
MARVGIFSPLAKLGLARAYAKQGEREKSRRAYDDFFTTWKDADPNIPILLQAKAEYKKLQATTSTIASASGNKREGPCFYRRPPVATLLSGKLRGGYNNHPLT